METKYSPFFVSIVIGCLMAAASFILNSWFIKQWGNKAFITIGPVIEEVSKSYLAWSLGADLLLTHITFGVIEGSYDLLTSRYGSKGCILSIGGHSLFGLVTIVVYAFSGFIGVGIVLACIVHIGYNLWMIYHFTNNQELGE
jgi:hypothetical protein